MKLINPILALTLLIWAAEKYRKTKAVDRKLRYYLQLLGSIPGAVSHTVRKLKKYELCVSADDCAENLSDEMKEEIMLPMLQKDRKSIEHLYLRACHLFNQIDKWGSIDSNHYQFKTAYHQSFENIKVRFDKLNRNTKRYYQLKVKLVADAIERTRESDENRDSPFGDMYPVALTEMRKDLKSELKSILDNIYIFIACAVHSKGVTAKKRQKLMTSLGFDIKRGNRLNVDGVDPNDLTILALFLIFVIPLAAIFASFAGDPNAGRTTSPTYVVWSAMALFVGLTSVAIPILVKQFRMTSDAFLWVCLRRKKGRPWCSYMLSGVLAAAAGVLGMCLLNYLDPERTSQTIWQAFSKILPWGLVPLSIALTLGYHLDRNANNGRRTIALEAVTTMLFSVLAAVLALCINEGIIETERIIKKMYFSLPASALLGAAIGAIIPYRYRRQAKRWMRINREEVDLKEIIQGSVDRFSKRADKERVQITLKLDASLPKLNIDPGQVIRSVDGLLSNALEFTPAKGKIIIAAQLRNEGGIRFSVKDNGIGMSKYKRNLVLQAKPEEVNAAWQQVVDCMDADLIQVRAIAEKHGAAFGLASRQWVGSMVWIDFPQDSILDAASEEKLETPMPTPVAVIAA